MRTNWYELAQCLSNIKIVQVEGCPTDTEMAQVILLSGLIVIAEVFNNCSFDSALQPPAN